MFEMLVIRLISCITFLLPHFYSVWYFKTYIWDTGNTELPNFFFLSYKVSIIFLPLLLFAKPHYCWQ